MLKKIHLNNSIGTELENRIESGDFKPTKLEPGIIGELEQRARRILKWETNQLPMFQSFWNITGKKISTCNSTGG